MAKSDGKSIILDISIEDAAFLVHKLYGLGVEIKSCKKLTGYDDKNFYMRGRLKTRGKCHNIETEREFVFKIINYDNSQDNCLLEAQTEIMDYLRSKGLNCSTSVLSLSGTYLEKVGLPIVKEERKDSSTGANQRYHYVRLLNYVPGQLLSDISNPSLELFYDTGQYTGRMSLLLQSFSNEALKKRNSIWDLKNILDVQQFADLVKEVKRRSIIDHFFHRISSQLVPMMHASPLAIIHGDVNGRNVIVEATEENDAYRVSGIIDFGDVRYTHRMFEPAILAAHMMLERLNHSDIFTIGGYILAGFQSLFPLCSSEIRLMPLVLAGRLIQLALLCLHEHSLQPENEYVWNLSIKALEVLEVFKDTSDEKIFDIWKKIFCTKSVEWPGVLAKEH